MYGDLPFWAAAFFVLAGLWALTWSAGVFIDGAEALARRAGISPFIVGMVVIGFGTSAPELFVSALSGCSGHSNLSLGNAYGSCNFNIAVILGIAALIRPISVKTTVWRFGIPLLLIISGLSYGLVKWGSVAGFTRIQPAILLAVFACVLPVYCWVDQREMGAPPRLDLADVMPIGRAFFCLATGLVVLVVSSHFLVWGAVDIARALHVSELLIGLTVVAAGTSLPELASAVVAARRGQHEFVLGNIIGSNFFNTLAVVGIAGVISPFADVSAGVVTRDLPVMAVLTFSVALFGFNFKKPAANGTINRIEAFLWIVVFAVYLYRMICAETAAA